MLSIHGFMVKRVMYWEWFSLQGLWFGIAKRSDMCYPVGIYLLKVNNRKNRTRCEIHSKLTRTPEQRHWRRSVVFIVTLNIIHTFSASVSIVNFDHVIVGWVSWKWAWQFDFNEHGPEAPTRQLFSPNALSQMFNWVPNMPLWSIFENRKVFILKYFLLTIF